MTESTAYRVRRASRSRFIDVRGLRYHVLQWGEPERAALATPLVLLHGWMDVAASFQFIVDALHGMEGEARHIIALDWRGFGRTARPVADCYWFPDYLGDLDSALTLLFGTEPVDLAGHSMGGNVAMVYAGVRPQRVRKLVNLEGFGMPGTRPEQAPKRYAQWLDELIAPAQLLPYDSVEAVAGRLRRNNPLLPADRAAWIAPHWAAQQPEGHWEILADPAHKRVNPVLYHKDEFVECWKQIAAPVLWLEGDQTDLVKWWGLRYSRGEFYERLSVVPKLQRYRIAPAGHMLHHDQPEAVAARVREFLDA